LHQRRHLDLVGRLSSYARNAVPWADGFVEPPDSAGEADLEAARLEAAG